MGKKQPDITVSYEGTIAWFKPTNQKAKRWMDNFLWAEPWQWMGGAMGVDHRYAGDIMALAETAGYKVQ